MAQRILTSNEVDEAIHVAVTSYEFSCDWGSAAIAVKEFINDDLNVKASPTQVNQIIQSAKLQWNHQCKQVKNKIAAEA